MPSPQRGIDFDAWTRLGGWYQDDKGWHVNWRKYFDFVKRDYGGNYAATKSPFEDFAVTLAETLFDRANSINEAPDKVAFVERWLNSFGA
jgi:hypothetical protein